MPEATVKSHSDAWVDQNAAHKNFGKGNRLWVRGAGSGHQRQSFISFAKPFPHNDALVVVSATLRLRVKDDWSGSHVVTAKRIIETWKEGRVTWTNAPDTTGDEAATETVANLSDGDEVEIDVTDILGDVSLGADWYGLRLELDDDVPRKFYASDTPHESYRPKLDAEWGFAPYPPTDLDPSGGQVVGVATPVLSWSFRDIVQENTQAAMQVQIADSTSFTGIHLLYDSGKVAHTVHRWNLAGETTIPDGATRYWRVKTYDDQNRGSGWSDTVRFQRIAKGVLSFVNPGPSNTVDDLTPMISWAFTGEQDQVALHLFEVLPDRTTRERWKHERSHYTADHLTIPARKKHPIIKRGHDYRLWLKIWDDEDRVGTSRDPAYAFASIDFTYERSGVPSDVTVMTAAVAPLAPPAIIFNWSRAVTPDYFALDADDEEVLHRIDPTDVAIAGSPGNYQMTYWEAVPGESTTYEIEAVEINGDHLQHSDNNQQRTLTTYPTGVWLIDDDADEAVVVKGVDQPDITIGESGTTYDLVAGRTPVRITDAIRGYEGSFSGLVETRAARDMLLELKGKGKELRLVIGSLNFSVYLEEVTVAPMPIEGGDFHQVSFTFFQSDGYFDSERDENY